RLRRAGQRAARGDLGCRRSRLRLLDGRLTGASLAPGAATRPNATCTLDHSRNPRMRAMRVRRILRRSARAGCPGLAFILPLLLTACDGDVEAEASGWTVTTYAPQNRPDVRGTTSAVSSDHPLATEVGMA